MTETNKPTPDRDEILRALAALFEPDDVIELRALSKGRKNVSAGYFDGEHREALADSAVKLNTGGAAVYVTLNKLNPQLLGRYRNRIEQSAQATAIDANVIRRRWLLIDLDPVRPKDTAATEAQVEAARDRARAVFAFLRSAGWPDPVIAESGNGQHLLYPLDLPNDTESTALVKGALDALAAQFDDPVVTVDRSVFNAARITKAYGTTSTKGDHGPDAPWRLSKIVSAPTRDVVVTVEMLRALAPKPEPVTSTRATTAPRGDFDLDVFLRRLGIDFEADQHDGRERFKLARCPFNADHGRGEAAIFREPSGKLGFKCLHNGCADRKWADVRALVDGPRETRRAPPQGRIEGGATTGARPDEWPDPRPIVAELPPAPAFDAKTLLPGVFADYVLDEADRMPCPPDYIAPGLLLAIGAVIGSRCALKPKRRDDWLVTPNLFGGVVGDPGSMKSPAIDKGLRFLDRLEADESDRQAQRMVEYAAEVAAHKAREAAIEKIMRDAAGGKKKQEAGDVMAAAVDDLKSLKAPEEPAARRFRTNDSTIEKIGDMLAKSPEGMLVFRDELVGLLASWEKEGHEGDRAFYLEAWNGLGSHSIDRIVRGSLFIPTLNLSVFGGIQPEKLGRYLAGIVDAADNDGRIQRFQMLVYPEPVPWEWRDRYPVKGAREAVRDTFLRLAAFDPLQDGAQPADDFHKVPWFAFDDAALEVFIEWITDLHQRVIPQEADRLLAQHWSKYPKLFCSVALILHLAEGRTGPVQADTALRAAAWCEYLAGHARRVYGLLDVARVDAARSLAQKIAAGKLDDGFTVAEVVKKDWSRLKGRREVEVALAVLEEAGHVVAVESADGIPGRPTVRYAINPKARRATR